jgi:hypothetical protein
MTRAFSPAQRMARTRARRRDGLICLELKEVKQALVEDALLRRGLLAAHKVDDKSKFAAAALVALHEWAEAQLTPPASPDDEVLRATPRQFDSY